jgi:L-amino acid N-acyltransferase YncA
MTTIRPTRIEDADQIARVQVESWKSTYAGIVPAAYLASLTPQSRIDSWKKQLHAGTTLIFVAEDETGIFGFVSGGALRDSVPGYDAELYAIYLLQQRQRAGVGRALLQKLAGQLQANGFQSMIVWVLARNPSLGFYTRLGGTQVASKVIEIGGAQLTEVAFGWPNIAELLR